MEVKKDAYKNGNILYLRPYFNGVRHGLQQTFVDGGRLSQMTEMLDDTGENWDYHEFHNTGGLSFRMPIRNRKRHGVCLCWSEEGVLIRKQEWNDDELHGIHTDWYPNGQKKTEITYIRGEFHGIHTEWYPNGQKKKECAYLHGDRNGMLTEWNEQGDVTSTTYYVKDSPVIVSPATVSPATVSPANESGSA